MPEILTRPATRDDLGAMAVILNPIIRAGGTTAYEEEMSAEAIGKKVIDDPTLVSTVVALDAAGAVAAFQWVARYDPPETHVGGIASFARLNPKLPGAGRAMFAATCAACRAAGLTAIDALIRADNVPGLSYYGAMGFQDHALHEGVPLNDGTPVDRVVKRFML
ncbi:MAG: GNAT family N-acetyltransferase [Pseudomonadota bacterium]